MINCQIPIYSSNKMHPYDKENVYMGKFYFDNCLIDHHDLSKKDEIINTWLLHPLLHDTGLDCRLLYWWYTNDSCDFDNTSQYQQLVNKYWPFTHVNKIIPFYVIEENCQYIKNKLTNQQLKISPDFLQFNTDVNATFGKLNKVILTLDYKYFNTVQGYQNYNLCTATGRPSNAWGGINLAALPPEQRVGVKPNNNQFVLFDYSSYHVYLIANLLGYSFPTKDIHSFFMKEYNIKDREESKKLTFRHLYGGVPNEYKHIKFFQLVEQFVNDINNQYIRKGYVESIVYKRPMSANNLGRMNKYKLFNYLLQCYETERNIKVILEINKYLYEKKTILSLYNYDGFLFDMEEDCVDDLKKILQKDNFPVTVKVGNNFGEMNELL